MRIQAHPAIGTLAPLLRERLSSGSVIRLHEPLVRRTTLRVGGNADLWVEPADDQDLSLVLEAACGLGVPWRIMGRGSNLLIQDGGVRGVVISLCAPFFSRIEWTDRGIRCGAGVRLRDLAQESRRRGLAGLEFLAGIPGSVGGALRMNAGAWNAATFDWLETVRFMRGDGSIEECSASRVEATYRRCDLFRDHIALAAVFRGDPSTPGAVEARLADLNRRRWASQPPQSSAGCIFKNPPGIPAGRLIEELGLKGFRMGGAVISPVHGNFIVNEGGATAAEVMALIGLMRQRALEERGILLETEVEVIGECAGDESPIEA